MCWDESKFGFVTHKNFLAFLFSLQNLSTTLLTEILKHADITLGDNHKSHSGGPMYQMNNT